MKKIFIHGLGQTPDSFYNVVKNIGAININCPSLKEIIKDKKVNYQNLYCEFSKYCDNFNEKIDLVGISLGGILALNYTIDNPKKVNSLVIIAAPYKLPKTLLKLQNIVFRILPKKMFESTKFTKNDFINLTKSMMNLNFESKIKKINCKTLIICGEKDKVNLKSSINLSKLLNTDIKIIENSKHEVNVDNHKMLADILKSFYNI